MGAEVVNNMKGRRAEAHRHHLEAACASLALALGAGCAAMPRNVPLAATSAPAATQPGGEALALATPTAPSAATVPVTPTVGEFALNLTPLATETALATLALPTESRYASAFELWDGLPTYPADSQAGFDFRVRYDPTTWAKTADQYGAPSLAHRLIAGCVISPTGGRGLPLNGTVDHEMRRINGVSFQINTAFVNGVRQFVTYVGGDGVIYTAFQVAFADQADRCLADTENVLGTLKAVSIYDATPVATP